MATTFADFTGDGNATKAFSFPSIKEADIKVDVDGVIKTSGNHYNITSYTTTGGGNVVFTSGNIPASPAAIRIFRDTDVDSAKATYTAGSSVKAGDLNNNHTQLLYAAQEEQNQTVLTSNIKDAAVTTAKISDNAVTTAKIANNAVGHDQIADSSIHHHHIQDATIIAADLASDSVTTAKIVDSNVTTAKIADANVTTAKIADSNVTTAKIADSNVTTAKIAGANVTDAKLASNSVITSKITDANVTTVKIADSNITLAKLASDLKQTTVTDDDTKLPTSGAIVDYVAGQLSIFGGFTAIANETQFPNTQKASGAAISISDAGGVVVNGSGTSTTGRTVGGSTVTINNIPSNFHSSTITSGVRLIVTSTGSGQIYNYHKATIAEDDLATLSGDINDFAERYRVGSTNPTSSLNAGDLFFNTGSGKLLVYNGTSSAWEETQSVGNFFINTLSSSSATGGGSATANGTAYRFTLSNAGQDAQQHIVSVDGVIQKPNSGTSQPSEGFAIDQTDIIFGSAPVNGASIFIITIGASVGIGTPSDGTVSTAKLASGAVTTAKIADSNITTAKIANGTIQSEDIADNQIITTKILDEAVTLAKLPHGTGSNNGKFLRANNGADPTFESVPNQSLSDASGTTRILVDTNFVEIYKPLKFDTDNSNIFKITIDGPTTLTKDSTYTLPEDGSNGQFLKTNGSGVLSFGTVNTDLVGDTSPQLGGALDMNNQNITANDSTGGGNNRIVLGSGADLQLWHDSSDSYIADEGTGALKVLSNLFRVNNAANNEAMIKAEEDAGVTLSFDGSTKFETTSAGVTVTGTVTDSKGELRNVPQVTASSNLVIVASHAGKHILHSGTGGWTINTSTAFAVGDMVTFINHSGSAQSIFQASGVTLYDTTDGATGDHSVTARGIVTAINVASNVFYLSGNIA